MDQHRRSSRHQRGRLATAVVALAMVVGVLAAPPAASAAAPPNLWVDKMTLDFGLVNNGLHSAPQTVTVHNSGPGTATGLTISGPTSSSIEQTATTCAGSLSMGAACTVTYRYSPVNATFPTDANANIGATGGTSVQLRLMGTPHIQPLSLRITPLGFDFGPTPVGSSSATQAVVITNRAGSTAVFTLNGSNTAPPAPAPFSLTANTCTSATSTISLAAGASCTMTYRFNPTAAGAVNRTLALAVNQSGIVTRTYQLSFRGFGGSTDTYPIKMTPTALDFGPVAVGTTAPAQTIVFTNTSSTPRTVEFYGGGSSTFGGAQSCAGHTLAPGATCTIEYAAQPTLLGFLAANTGIALGVPGFAMHEFPTVLMVNGTGTIGRPEVSPTKLNLGPSAVGVATPAQQITLTNGGTAALTGITIAQSEPPAPQFTSTGTTCSTTLAVGATCTYNVRYTPTTTTRKEAHYLVHTAQGDTQVYVVGGPRTSVHASFVIQAIGQFLDRGPTPSELSTAAGALDAGTLTRRAFVSGLAVSDEWIEAVVQDLYRDTLDREGDPGGVGFWVRRIQAGTYTVAQVAAQFYASNEYFNGIGGGTNTSWITDLYVKLLERSPDSGGLAYWVGQTVAHGRVNVAGRMYQSAESRRARVTNLYGKLLFRSPDAAGRDYWAGRIETEGDIALAIELASSSEYLRLAQRLEGEGG